VSLHHDGVCTKHLFGHLRTMMTRANSLHLISNHCSVLANTLAGKRSQLGLPQ